MSPVSVACLLVLSVVTTCHAQVSNYHTSSFDACSAATTNAIDACLVTSFGAATAGNLMGEIASDDFDAMYTTICGAQLSTASLDSLFTCLKPQLAKCNQSHVTVTFFTGASGADIQDLCVYGSQCPRMLTSMQISDACIAPLRAVTTNTACRVANIACFCVNTESNTCAVAKNAQLYSSRVNYAYGVAQQYRCSNSDVQACGSGSNAVGPAILLVVATALFRVL